MVVFYLVAKQEKMACNNIDMLKPHILYLWGYACYCYMDVLLHVSTLFGTFIPAFFNILTAVLNPRWVYNACVCANLSGSSCLQQLVIQRNGHKGAT